MSCADGGLDTIALIKSGEEVEKTDTSVPSICISAYITPRGRCVTTYVLNDRRLIVNKIIFPQVLPVLIDFISKLFGKDYQDEKKTTMKRLRIIQDW